MKKHNGWSYQLFTAPFLDRGDINICRIVPKENSILLEWNSCEDCGIFCRERGKGKFEYAGKTSLAEYEITGLSCGREYEFYVQSGEKRSLVRLARTGTCEGTAVNYLHPDDGAYAFSGRFLCSPSLLIHPDGYMLASMDLFAPEYPQNLTLLFRSDDDGESWHAESELFPCFWGKLFIHRNAVYMIAVSTEYGDLMIGKSDDGGRTFGEPHVLLRGLNGKHGAPGVHKTPMPLLTYGGRLWMSMEWGSWGSGYHAVMVASAPEDADLTCSESWTFSQPVKYDSGWPGVPKGESFGNIEGELLVIDGKLHNIMRYSMENLQRKYGLVVDYLVDTARPDAPLKYNGCIEFPCNNSKFEMMYDEVSGKYIAIGSRIYDETKLSARNLLSLLVSDDGKKWRVASDIIDKRAEDCTKVGFQYISMAVEGDDLVFLCRTAMNGADSYHNSNYITFQRIKDFRRLID